MAENKFKIKITPKAYEDLEEIYSYIVNELFNRDAAERLRNFPYKHRKSC